MNTIFCNICETEATHIVLDTNTVFCATCHEAFRLGQIGHSLDAQSLDYATFIAKKNFKAHDLGIESVAIGDGGVDIPIPDGDTIIIKKNQELNIADVKGWKNTFEVYYDASELNTVDIYFDDVEVT